MKKRPDLWSVMLSGLPPFGGKVRLADAIARIAGGLGDGWGTCSTEGGATIRLNLGDRIERQMWGGCYEPHVKRSLRALLTPGETYVDVGAHIGYHAVAAASIVGSRGRIFAFEADPKNFARLNENLSPFQWSVAVNKAVWSSTGSATFERSSQAGESGWGTLTAVRDLVKGEHISVDLVSIDDWSQRSGIGDVSVMKIDAEGSEVSILQGAARFLQQARPTVIIEANDVVLRQAGTSAIELTERLHQFRYDLYELDLETLRFLPPGESPRSSDLLAVPSERAKSVTALLERAGFHAGNPDLIAVQ